jgi:hypothetical protein
MRRTFVVVSFTILTLASSSNTALAQTPATGDSVSHSYIDTGPAVDTASQKLRRNPRDLALGNCQLRGQSPIGYVLPLFCARKLNGLIDRALFDSVTFVGPDHDIRFATNDVRALTRFNHDRRMRKVNGALIGGGLGFFSTLLLGVMKGSDTNNQGFKSGGGPSVGTAFLVGGMGALAGALSGSRYSGDFPPYLADAQQ